MPTTSKPPRWIRRRRSGHVKRWRKKGKEAEGKRRRRESGSGQFLPPSSPLFSSIYVIIYAGSVFHTFLLIISLPCFHVHPLFTFLTFHFSHISHKKWWRGEEKERRKEGEGKLEKRRKRGDKLIDGMRPCGGLMHWNL